MVSGKRIEFIDLAKGVCIILVVAFHTELTAHLVYLKALRMPLYFILSGLFFKDYGSFIVFLEKKVNRILIPALFFFLLFIVFQLIVTRRMDLSEFISPVLTPQMPNLPVWFLICLFWINVIFCLISIYVKQPVIRAAVVGVCGIAGWLLSMKDIYLPLYISAALSALPFFYIGYLLRKIPLLYKNKYDRFNLPLSILLLGIPSAYCLMEEAVYISFRTNLVQGNMAVIYLVSLSLVIGLLLLCKAVGWLPVVSYLGRYSIIVLGLHGIVISWICYPVCWLARIEATPAVLFAMSMCICWIAIPLCRKMVPAFTAQADCVRFSRKKAVAA